VPNVLGVYSGVSTSTLIKLFHLGCSGAAGATLFWSWAFLGWDWPWVRSHLGHYSFVGSLIPIAILHPEELSPETWGCLIVGTVMMVLGLVFLRLPGGLARPIWEGTVAPVPGFTGGLVICIFSGIFFLDDELQFCLRR